MACLFAYLFDGCERAKRRWTRPCVATDVSDADTSFARFNEQRSAKVAGANDVSPLLAGAAISYDPPPPAPCASIDASYCATLYDAMRQMRCPTAVPQAQWDAYVGRLHALNTRYRSQLSDLPPIDNFQRLSVQQIHFELSADRLYSHVQVLLSSLPASIELPRSPDGIDCVD